MNALLVHVPKGFFADSWDGNAISLMSMGLFSVANHALDAGHRVRVTNPAVHGGREAALARLHARIDEGAVRVVGLSLHWHFAGADVLDLAAHLKRRDPALRIVLGGVTATVFAADILAHSEAVDAVVRGDSEVPFTAYLDALDEGGGAPRLRAVPNLTWRDGDAVVSNDVTHVATAADLARLDFRPSRALVDVAEYAPESPLPDIVAGRPQPPGDRPVRDRSFHVAVGRGCAHDCYYCAGSRAAQAAFYGRRGVAIRPVDAVLETVADAHALGFRGLHLAFDPPFPGREAYYRELFGRIAREIDPTLSILFELYHLPSAALLDAFAASFAVARLAFSPCYFDDAIRRRYKGYHYTLDGLRGALDAIGRRPNLRSLVFFAVSGLEAWGPAEVAERKALMRSLEVEHGCRVAIMPYLIEPGCPGVSLPDVFGRPPVVMGFEDFLREWRKPLDTWNEALCPGVPDLAGVMAALTAD